MHTDSEKLKKRKTLWRLWASALGEKSGKNNKEANTIALIRTLIFMSYLTTNLFIVYGVMRTHHYPVYHETQITPHIGNNLEKNIR